MKKVFVCFLFFASMASAVAFHDVEEDYPYIDAVEYLTEQGIISGYPDGSFKPYDSISRAELMKVLTKNLIGEGPYPASYKNCFPDVGGDWYAPYVCHAYYQDWVEGYDDGYFRPDGEVTRAEAVKMLINSQGLGGQISDYNHTYTFDDVDGGAWYAPYVWVARENGFLVENDSGSTVYHPDNLMVRGEISENLYRVLVDGVVPPVVEPDELAGLCYDEECEDENPDYVIITRPLFLAAIQDFVKWKEDNGFDVGVLTVEWIEEVENEDNPAKNIKEVIKDFANNHGTEYFVLVGDTISSEYSWKGSDDLDTGIDMMYDLSHSWNVPSGYFCINSVADFDVDGLYNGLYNYSGNCMYVTDVYYADFDDEDWEENEDGYIVRGNYLNSYWYDNIAGEFMPVFGTESSFWENPGTDDRPLDFETIVARIPVRDPDEFGNVFNKIKSFDPAYTVSLLADVTLINESEINGEEGSIYSDWCSYPGVTVDEFVVHDHSCANDFAMLKNLVQKELGNFVYETFDLTDYNDVDEVTSLLLNETTVVIPNFHGSHSDISVLYWEDLSDFNYIFPAWISSSCSIGTFSFGDEDSFTEALIKAEKGPAFVIRPMNYYYFFKYLLEGKTVGEAFYNTGETIVRYLANWDVLFGDPSLKIFDLD